jgi:hypothetical protein
MEHQEKITELAKALEIDLRNLIRKSDMRAMQTHWCSIVLMTVALVCSFLAGIAGLAQMLPKQLIGAIALIPGTASVAASSFSLQARANWHYRKSDALTVLVNRLSFPAHHLTQAEIAAISKERSELIARMQLEWQKSVEFNWHALSGFKHKKP